MASEAKWWPKGVVPTEPGEYYAIREMDGEPVSSSKTITQDGEHEGCPDRQYFGPIPDPPKAPPKVRRFTATFKGESVTGAFANGEYVGNRVMIWRRHGADGAVIQPCGWSELTDIQWLDKE